MVSDVVWVALIAAVPSTLAAVLGIANRQKLGAVETKVDGRLTELLGIANRQKLGAVETKVDGRLTELLELTTKSSHAEGVKDELAREK